MYTHPEFAIGWIYQLDLGIQTLQHVSEVGFSRVTYSCQKWNNNPAVWPKKSFQIPRIQDFTCVWSGIQQSDLGVHFPLVSETGFSGAT